MDLDLFGIGSAFSSFSNTAMGALQWRRDDRLMQRQMDREDNAVQRRVADLKAAGLSPVLAAGSAAQTSAPIASSKINVDNPFSAYLGTVQQKKDIASTEAGTELAKFQSQSEQYKQLLMNQQVAEIDQRIKNMQSEKLGTDLRNSWINLDMFSQLGLRDSQMAHMSADTLRIGQQTELLKAQTAYEQTAMDKLLTDIDNAKIMRDMNNFDLTTRGIKLYNDSYAVNKGLIGRMFGDIRQPFSGFDIRHAIKNVDSSWYWDNK